MIPESDQCIISFNSMLVAEVHSVVCYVYACVSLLYVISY